MYGCIFNYNKVGIRIRDGGSYVQKQQLASVYNRGAAPGFLYIEDPMDPGWLMGPYSMLCLKYKHSLGEPLQKCIVECVKTVRLFWIIMH